MAVKIGVFCLMAGISAYHAFFLRPRLVRLVQQVGQHYEDAFAKVPEQIDGEIQNTDQQASTRNIALRKRTRQLAGWLEMEALLGVVVLLCVALLGAFAGTLTTIPQSTSPTGQTSPAHGPFLPTQRGQGDVITLRVSPDSFGTNTFRITVQDAQGHPVQGAAVLLETTMLDMDMGTQEVQLPAVPSSPGTFEGPTDLTMAGHWQIIVRLLPPNVKQYVRYTFTLSAV
ncbi:MAG TPA: FixH family protein [Ktedonobacteraceae bacterium]|jgi:hypothetical protein